jgi:uncharacterized repeat protein (TIGR01451 family)
VATALAAVATVTGAWFATETAAPQAFASASDAGVPNDPTIVFREDFENFPTAGNGDGSQALQLDHYAGVGGRSYTANPAWLDGPHCEGTILSAANHATHLPGCPDASAIGMGNLAYALAGVSGHVGDAAANNHALTAYTLRSPGANLIEFATVQSIPVAAGTGRFFEFSVDAAEVNCRAVHAAMDFSLLNTTTSPATETRVRATAIDPCLTTARTLGSAGLLVAADRYYGDAPILFTGTSAGLRMVNLQGGADGNDAAFDNIQLRDVTPQLEMVFSPAAIIAGETSRLTLTVTNTSELSAKTPFGFVDMLPAGVDVAAAPNAVSTCGGSSTVNAAASSDSVSLSNGSLVTGEVSCTVEVDVVAVAGTHTQSSANLAATGLNEPAPATFEVAAASTNFSLGTVLTSVNGRAATSTSVVLPADELRFTLTVSNSGNIAGATIIQNPVPASTTYTGIGEGWSCPAQSPSGVLCSQSIVIEPGSTVTLYYTVSVLPTLALMNTHIIEQVGGAPCGAASSTCRLVIPLGSKPAMPVVAG